MPKYTVNRKEIHYSIHEVEAGSPEEAVELVEDGVSDNEIMLEYSHTADTSEWQVVTPEGKTIYCEELDL